MSPLEQLDALHMTGHEDDNPVVEMVSNGAVTREEFKDGSIRWSDPVGPMPSTLQDACEEAFDMAVKVMQERIDNMKANKGAR